MSKATPAPVPPKEMEINFDRASKFYEPTETVTGTVLILGKDSYEHGKVTLIAEAYMDTVSAIRGNVGRAPLPVDQRIYFMQKSETVTNQGRTTPEDPIKFSFVNSRTF